MSKKGQTGLLVLVLAGIAIYLALTSMSMGNKATVMACNDLNRYQERNIRYGWELAEREQEYIDQCARVGVELITDKQRDEP